MAFESGVGVMSGLFGLNLAWPWERESIASISFLYTRCNNMSLEGD